MTIPAIDRTEYFVSGLGYEIYPQSIYAKGTLWILKTGFDRIYIEEYEGNKFSIEYPLAQRIYVSYALDAFRAIDVNKFWLWAVGQDNALSLFELEPFSDIIPSITFSRLDILSDVLNVNAVIRANEIVSIIALLSNGNLKSVVFNNIKDPDPPIIGDLNWSPSRTDEFSNFLNVDRTVYFVSYIDVASPPNVYLESYSVGIPGNFSASQVGSTNEIQLTWDVVVDADEYFIERDTNSLFPSPTSFYTSLLTYTDYLPANDTFYYRIRSLNNTLLLQSLWSSTEEVTLTMISNFEASPLYAYTDVPIYFTDLSTGIVTSWDWDFGDGSPHSTDQNPIYSYNTPGHYTVSLIVSDGTSMDTNIKPSYIWIDFNGIPPNLFLVF